MFWLGIVLLVLIGLFVIIIFTKLTILVNYHHQNDDDHLKVEFRIWLGLIKYKLDVPLVKVDEDSPSVVVKTNTYAGDSPDGASDGNVEEYTKKDIKSYLKNRQLLRQQIFKLNVIMKKFLRKVSVKKFEWQSLIGVGDAAHTGVISGALWSVKGGIIGLVSHYLNLKAAPQLSITPHFQASVFHTRISCIFQFRIGHAILAGLKLIKFWKGGKLPSKDKTGFSNEKNKSV
ncbi:DUF2953 domain-containing protein [Neobacillus dielmonensis]|uniref:DUF2953 domain-containing protein n=1 Tax=Neobacillus dielmonensis TaxID=1347369 RepID=UPI0005AB69FF|nr:DUF2953 domain-containing protein [Neobacillus dielmonensis]